MSDKFLDKFASVFVAVSLIICVLLLIYSLVSPMYISHLKNTADCSAFVDWAMKEVPARCVSYFQRGQ